MVTRIVARMRRVSSLEGFQAIRAGRRHEPVCELDSQCFGEGGCAGHAELTNVAGGYAREVNEQRSRRGLVVAFQRLERAGRAGVQTIGASRLVTVLGDDTLTSLLVDAALAAMAVHVVGHRPGRVEPRAIKRRPKEHASLTNPRPQARAELIGAKPP